MKGRNLVLAFYGLLGVMAVTMYFFFWSAVKGTPDEKTQRELARAMPSLYQKYFLDNGEWPSSPKEAAIHFRSENPDFLKRVKDAEQKWGFKAEVLAPAEPNSKLKVEFDKPQKQTLDFVLEKKRS